MTSTGNRIEVLHGVNLDQLGKRDPSHYGSFDLAGLQARIEAWGQELGLQVTFFQSNHEGQFVERLHQLRVEADGLILNPGAWTHYSYAIRDAMEITGLPTVEVHLSDVNSREPWRHVSVIRELCIATVAGKGADGYREALEILRDDLEHREQRR
ncbi:MAG: type II 3-dehydroquinate dehydratase [Solirubrobacteraceae bacterium]